MELEEALVLAMQKLDEIANDKLFEVKFAAVFKLRDTVVAYKEHGYLTELPVKIFNKKFDFIFHADSRADIKEILAPTKVHYNYNEIMPDGEFYVAEEELILWSLTSLVGPLVHHGYERYMKVFAEILPEQAKKLSEVEQAINEVV